MLVSRQAVASAKAPDPELPTSTPPWPDRVALVLGFAERGPEDRLHGSRQEGALASRAFVDNVEKKGRGRSQGQRHEGRGKGRPDRLPHRAGARVQREYAKKFGQKTLDSITAVK